MDKHALHVWKHFIEPNENIKNILMIAHSAGGGCASSIINKYRKTVVKKVKLLAFTDACQGNFDEDFEGKDLNWVKSSCISYDASDAPLKSKLNRENKF